MKKLKKYVPILVSVIFVCSCAVLFWLYTTAKEPKGIYYPALESPEHRDFDVTSSYAYLTLAYKDGVYTSAEHYQKSNPSDLPLDLLGEEIGPVYGNHGIGWSADKDALIVADCEATLYKVKGYDDTFRVALYWERYIPAMDETRYELWIFKHLNDIWLYKGGDLYKDRFHWDNAVSAARLPLDNEVVKEFMNAVYEAKFIDPKDETLPDFSKLAGYVIQFEDANKLTSAITLYEGGYGVTYSTGGLCFIVRLDEALCQEMIATAKEQQTWDPTLKSK